MFKNVIGRDNRIAWGILLVAFGVIGRVYLRGLLPHTPSWYITINGISQPIFMMDMFFIVAVVSLLSGLLLGGIYALIVPLLTMIITDIYYGNNYILLFTWSGFAMIGVLGHLVKKKRGLSIRNIPTIFGVGIIGVLLYDLWTNFGSWLGWYPHTLDGLALCYTLAIPFTMWHILSSSMLILLVVVPIAYLKEHNLLKINSIIKPMENRTTIMSMVFLLILTISVTII